MAVGAYAEELEVDAAGLGEGAVVGGAGGGDVGGGAVGADEGGFGEAEGFDDLAQDDGAVGLGVAGRQAHVLVELADAGPGGVEGGGADLGGEGLVDGEGVDPVATPRRASGLVVRRVAMVSATSSPAVVASGTMTTSTRGLPIS